MIDQPRLDQLLLQISDFIEQVLFGSFALALVFTFGCQGTDISIYDSYKYRCNKKKYSRGLLSLQRRGYLRPYISAENFDAEFVA